MLNAPRERVWQMLNDPAFLQTCLPGCESLEAAGPDRFQATMTIGIAAVKGKYTGTVTLSEKEPPQRFKMRVEGKGTGGFMQGTGDLALADDPQGTKVTYQGDVQVGGPIASVGQRLLEGVVKMLVGQFFAAVNTQLAAMAATPSPPATPSCGPGHAAPPGAVQSFTAAPRQLSSRRTVLQSWAMHIRERLRQWVARSS
jgi:hypothetical protein